MRKVRRKVKLPRAPLPRQTGGAHGTRRAGRDKRLRARIKDALDRRGEE